MLNWDKKWDKPRSILTQNGKTRDDSVLYGTGGRVSVFLIQLNSSVGSVFTLQEVITDFRPKKTTLHMIITGIRFLVLSNDEK